jgi:nucleoside-diphosphate-sugar epimerase
MKTKILVCGATGFIGRNMVEQLSKRSDFEILAVKHKRAEYKVENAANPVKWIQADLRSPVDVARTINEVDIIIQAAATTSGAKDILSRPYIHVTDNAVMNSYLLREAFEKKIKHFIFFSCTVMYQSSINALKESDWNESLPINQRYFGVGNTKTYIEKMLEFFSTISEMKTTAIRHSNIYGPHDKFDLEKSHVFGATITKVMTSSESISVWGSGEEERDLLYVDDLVRFVELAISKQTQKFRLYNCGVGQKISIKNLVEMVIKLSGKKINVEHDLSKPTIKTSLFLDNSRAINEIGWTPKVGLEEGIIKTLQWWKDNIKPATLNEKIVSSDK